MHLLTLDKPLGGSVVTVGTFDGVHLGHRVILERLLNKSKQFNLPDVVVTFRVHPRLVIEPDFKIKLLTLIDEKIDLLDKLGVSNVYILPFDKRVAAMSGEEFVRYFLVDRLNVKHLVVGFDHRFGRGRQTGYEQLLEIGKKFGFSVERIEPVLWDGEKISSTRIRRALEQGFITVANQMLGYNYFFSGRVIEGNKLGKKLGVPTANLQVHQLKQMPKYGVYVVRVYFEQKSFFGVMNYGLRPTINQDVRPIAEVHIFDFDMEIYNKSLKVEILAKLRDEKRFSSLAELHDQILRDIDKAKSWLFDNFFYQKA